MIVLDYEKKYHHKLIHGIATALKAGKIVAYPTDTSYGLAVDASNLKAIKKLYRVKGRDFKKPIHIIPPSVAQAKKIVAWGKLADKLYKKFCPGALTLVLELKTKDKSYQMLSAGSKSLGVRRPKNLIALDLAKYLKNSITATSANISGKPDSYSAKEVAAQFKKQKYKPDIIIAAGKLPKRKPSTVVKINNRQLDILREGPVSEKEIIKLLRNTKKTKY